MTRRFRDEVKRRLAGARIDPTRRIEITEEIGQDLDERYDELVAGGAPPAQAEAQVLAELEGNDTLARELARVEAGPRADAVAGAPSRGLAADLWHDLRYGVRSLIKSPAFTIVTLLSLALGIGANAAIFQLIDSLEMRALPVARPDELASVKVVNSRWRSGGSYGWHSDLTYPMWEKIREGQEGFTSLLAWGDETFDISPGGEIQPVRGIYVSDGFFTTLGVPPHLGRVFTAGDDRRGCGMPGAVVSYTFWKNHLGGDPAAIGRRLTLDGHETEILGVSARGFFGLEVDRSYDVAVPLCAEATLRGEDSRMDVRHDYWLSVIGRLKPGWTVARAGAQLDALSPGLFAAVVPPEYPTANAEKFKAYRLGATSAARGISLLRREFSRSLYFLLGTAGLVLLIACANLANLLLARASIREREIAVRMALGASRGRLIRQLMTESLLLAAGGAALGLWVARTLGELMIGLLATRGDSHVMDLTPDWRVLVFTVGLAVLTCLLFGLAPALRAARTEIGIVLKATSGHGATASRFGLRRILVAVQVAMSFVLLTGAILFSRSLAKLSSVDAGFDEQGVIIFSVDARRQNVPIEGRLAAHQRLLDTLRAVPGVTAAASTRIVPLAGNRWNDVVTVEGKQPTDKDPGLEPWFSRVSPQYFAAMKVPILAGRDFGPQDDLGAPGVAIVNQTFATKMFAGASPIGRQVRIDPTAPAGGTPVTIIGLVADTKYGDLREPPQPLMYVAAAQDKEPDPYLDIVVRHAGGTAQTAAALKQAVAAEPGLSIDVDSLDRLMRDTLQSDRMMALLSGGFGLLAGLLATIGLYGVVAYSVARRTHEIGIRMALGADRYDVAGMVLRETAGLLAIGLGFGVLLALGATRAAASMLYGLEPHDPATYAIAVALLATVTFVASALPARRAAGVDPMVALKDE